MLAVINLMNIKDYDKQRYHNLPHTYNTYALLMWNNTLYHI